MSKNDVATSASRNLPPCTTRRSAARLAVRNAIRSEQNMKPIISLCGLLVVASLTVCVLSGCGRSTTPGPADEPPAISVSYGVQREVTDYSEFTGRLAAVDSVEVRAHVWGYLDRVNFKEGAIVQKGDVLFELDPRPYQALLEEA